MAVQPNWKQGWFGLVGESRKPTARRKIVARKVLSWSQRPKLTEYHRWTFQNYYAGIHVEQATIHLLKTFGFSPIYGPDWFELDVSTIDAAIEIIDELAAPIIDWEKRNNCLECNAVRSGKPYGDYVLDTDFVTVETWDEAEDGRLIHIPEPLEVRLAERAKWYEGRRKVKMPDGLKKLIEANVALSRSE